MMSQLADPATPAAPAAAADDPALHRVYDTARRFIAHRERMALIEAGQLPAPRNLAEAIDRDFLAFDLKTALEELREAVIAMEPSLAALPDTAG
jgi:hypothetical protein